MRTRCRNQFCKVHYYWDFVLRDHYPYPLRLGSTWVYVGPPAYYPRKPLEHEQAAMNRQCPHTQMDLTCNTCLRHMFRPLEIK